MHRQPLKVQITVHKVTSIPGDLSVTKLPASKCHRHTSPATSNTSTDVHFPFTSLGRCKSQESVLLAYTMDDPPLASLSLTHVHYNPHDPVSHLCAYLALVPQALMITYVALIWSTREIEIALMFAGQLGCEALNWGLKRWIREERPTRTYRPSAIP